MPPELTETRTHYTPRTGTKVVLLVGLVIIIAAIYAALMPLNVRAADGTDFGCGSAVNPNNSAFGKNYCKDVDRGGQYRAVAVAASGLGVIGVGAFLFGFDTTTRTRNARPGFDDGYDDDEDDTPTPPRRRPRNSRDSAGDVVEETLKPRVGADRSPRRRPMTDRTTRDGERETTEDLEDGVSRNDLEHDASGLDEPRAGRSKSRARRSTSHAVAQRGRRGGDDLDDLDGGDLDGGDFESDHLEGDTEGRRGRR